MQIFISSFLLLFLMACTPLNATPLDNEQYDYYVILSDLLGINEGRYSYVDGSGNIHSDQLKLFKELERVYTAYAKTPHEDNSYSQEQIKVIMLFAFYAKNRNSAAFSEYLASDLVPIYSKNQQGFLRAMAELPFLISPTCNRLDAFFGFEGRNLEGKEVFIVENKMLFEKHFSEPDAANCLAQYR